MPTGFVACDGISCCSHETCARVKRRGWCKTLVFVRWIAVVPVLPSEMREELQTCLQKRQLGRDIPFRVGRMSSSWDKDSV